MKRILDPTFRYQPSYATDLRKTFERIRRERRTRAHGRTETLIGRTENILRIRRPS